MLYEMSKTEEVWVQFHCRIRSFFSKRVSNAELAEELLQTTFLKVHENVHKVKDPERIAPWLFRLARNVLVDHYRSRALANEQLAEEIEAEIQEEKNLNEEVASWLPVMIQELPDKYREPLVLYEMDGLSQQAIADRLGLSLSGAKSRIQRGRSKLKDILLECCSFQKDRLGNLIDYQRNRPEDCRYGCD